MVTFKAIVISTNKRKDGTYPVKIRVTFKGVSRRLPTTMVATSNDLTRSLKIKNNNILNKADDIIRQMRSVTDCISPFDLEEWDVDRVVATIRKRLSAETFTLDFFEWGEEFARAKKPTTGRNYLTALNSFARFLGKRRLDINEISRSMLLEYMDFVEREPSMRGNPHKGGAVEVTNRTKKPRATASRNITMMEAMYRAAKDKFNDEDEGKIVIPKSPFSRIERSIPASVGQKSLGVDLMQRLILAEAGSKAQRTALDAFVVSFGLMGANMADLYEARAFDGDWWVYHRRKTTDRRADKAEMRVRIPEELRPYLDRLRHGRGSHWLNNLHNYAGSKDYATANVNNALRTWQREHGVQDFTFYAARHTWATLARQVGVEKATIDECLAHKGDYDMADIYAERNWDLLQEANRKVLALFDWGK